MVKIYTCNRCHKYKTNLKNNLKRHMNRKKPCIKIAEKTNKMAEKTNKMTKKTTKSNDLEPQRTTNNQNSDASEPQRTTNSQHGWTCNYCARKFTTNSHMNRHIRLYCRVKKSKMEMLKNRVDTLEQTVRHVIDNSNYNMNSHNTTNSHNSHNTINNITINAYGKEDLSHLIPHVIIEVIRMKTLDESIETWTKLKYNDKKNHPENCTVQMPKDHSKYAEISAGDGKWNTTTKKQLVIEITNNAYSQLKTFIMNNPHRFGVSFYDKFQRFFEVSKELKNTVECALISKALPRKEDIDIPDILKYANYNVKHTMSLA